MKLSVELDKDDLEQMHFDSGEFVAAIKYQLLNAEDDEGGTGEDWLPDNVHLSVNFNGVCIHQENIITSDDDED